LTCRPSRKKLVARRVTCASNLTCSPRSARWRARHLPRYARPVPATLRARHLFARNSASRRNASAPSKRKLLASATRTRRFAARFSTYDARPDAKCPIYLAPTVSRCTCPRHRAAAVSDSESRSTACCVSNGFGPGRGARHRCESLWSELSARPSRIRHSDAPAGLSGSSARSIKRSANSAAAFPGLRRDMPCLVVMPSSSNVLAEPQVASRSGAPEPAPQRPHPARSGRRPHRTQGQRRHRRRSGQHRRTPVRGVEASPSAQEHHR
jgi:hypothetical protein